MKIKGIRHVGFKVSTYDFAKIRDYLTKHGGKVIAEAYNDFDERTGCVDTIKVQFEDGSIVELTTGDHHVAFNVEGIDTVLWNTMNMELVPCKK